ncbi:MAG: hypothetical protein U0174_20420 [Polyangiaceae bacterium]
MSRSPRSRARFLATAIFAAASVLPNAALADDVATVEQKLQTIEREPAAAPQQSTAAEPIARAREALGRARAFRNAGDELHAKLAIALAQEWTLAAEDMARAATMERKAAAAAKETDEAKKRIAREETQLEEQLVRGARLRASVEAREKESVGRPRAPEPASSKAESKGAKASGAKGPKAPKGAPRGAAPKSPTETKGEAP